MDRIEIAGPQTLRGAFVPPPDKSVSHRAVFFSSLADGKSSVKNYLLAEDTLSTVSAFRALGIAIEQRGSELLIEGKGLHGLREPADIIDCGNSGTTMRLLTGVLSGNPFLSILTGDASLRKRPMQRVVAPLRDMGADIRGREDDRYAPLAIRGKKLKPLRYTMPVASAQVKSAILLAGLYADGETVVTEPQQSRDHTEKMLSAFGADIRTSGLSVAVTGQPAMHGNDTLVPADFSSAAFLMVGALILRGSEVSIENVGINPTRTGLLQVLRRMGAIIDISNVREVSGEVIADLHCRGTAGLKAVAIQGDEVPLLIDEFPILCVAATQAEGTTTITGAEELRVKESDRIRAMATELRKFGAAIEEYPDGIAIQGKTGLKGCSAESYHDHRIAMSLTIAGLAATGLTTINGASCVNISFPGFYDIVRRLSGR